MSRYDGACRRIGRQGQHGSASREQFGSLDAIACGQAEVVEGMHGDVDSHLCVLSVEVGHDEQQLVLVLAQEGVLAVGVEVGRIGIGVHEVEEVALGDGSLVACNVEQTAVAFL